MKFCSGGGSTPNKRRVKIKTYKRRAPGKVRKTITVRGHYRRLPKSKKRRRKSR